MRYPCLAITAFSFFTLAKSVYVLDMKYLISLQNPKFHWMRLESSFDWTSQPAITEKVADIDSASFAAWNWIEIDVTDYVKAHSGNIISFALMNEGVDSEENHLLFYSREKEGHEPQLVIE